MRQRLARQPDIATVSVAGALVIATLGAMAVATGRGLAAVGLAAIPVALFVVPRLSRAVGLPAGYFSIEVPVGLLLLSTLVFRMRDAGALADNPLDSAALYRLACVGAAALLAWLTLLRPRATSERVPIPTPVVLFGVYVAVVFLGAPLSVNLPLTAYRGVELAVGLLVVVAAVQYGGTDAVRRLERTLYGFFVLVIAAVWIGVLLFPGEAVNTESSPVPFQISGIYPALSSNGVGETGALLVLWSLGLRLSGRRVGRWNLSMIALGAVTLAAAQYRTGYLALAVTVALLLLIRGRKTVALLVTAGVLAVLAWSPSTLIQAAEPYALRGQSREQAKELSGRMELWEKSIPVWRESPLLGKGLLTGTRFEVLAPAGLTTVAAIHGTWIEVLVGTGLVGLALLAAFLVLLWRSALPDLFSRTGLVYPGLLLAFITVRSTTGSSFEVFGVTALLILVLAYRLNLEASQRRRLAARTGA